MDHLYQERGRQRIWRPLPSSAVSAPSSLASGQLERPVVVAVVPVGVMEVTVDEVVDVVAVGHGLVAAAGAVDVAVLVTGAAVCGGAGGRVAFAHLDHVLVHVVAMGVVEVAVVEVVHVVTVLDGDVAAVGAVDVVVVLVLVAVHIGHVFGRVGPTVEW